MITTPTVPVAGTSGRSAPAVAPAQHTAVGLAPAEAKHTESAKAVEATAAPDRAQRYIAEREEAMRARLSEQAAEAAVQETKAPAPPSNAAQQERVEPIELLPPPATEVLAKGGQQSRLEARAEMFEAEARLRMLQKASAGYEEGRTATA